jgi:hypothetical protein
MMGDAGNGKEFENYGQPSARCELILWVKLYNSRL